MLSAKCKMLAMPSRNDLMTTTDGTDYRIIFPQFNRGTSAAMFLHIHPCSF